MSVPPPVPGIPGWHVHTDGDVLVARRATGLTQYMIHYGALLEIRARDWGELWILCDAQTRLAERLATAEWLRPETLQRLARRDTPAQGVPANGAAARGNGGPRAGLAASRT